MHYCPTLNTNAPRLTFNIQMRSSVRTLQIFTLSFTMLLLSQHYETLYGTQTGRDDLLITRMIDPLFSFVPSAAGNENIFL